MHDLRAIASDFVVSAQLLDVVSYGSGHINDTFLATYQSNQQQQRYILQRINHRVFHHPEKLMENVLRVTDHQRNELQCRGVMDIDRRVLRFICTHDGRPFTMDALGNYWRLSPFIEGTRAYDGIDSPELAWQAAKAFGFFQELTSTLPGPRLHETIPNFHNTELRFQALMEAADADAYGRRFEVAVELDFVLAREQDCSRIVRLLQAGMIPERVTHNDTKINNVLLDERSGEGLCVIDLDTTMPGSALYDFGDMVRTVTPVLDENATNVAHMGVSMERYEALIRGYCAGARFLTSAEKEQLAFAGKLITLECGMRFLTDYLNGDQYFKCTKPQQNLERCRNQFSLVEALEQRMNEAEDLVDLHGNAIHSEPPRAR